MTWMSLFAVNVNDPPVAVTETGFGITLLFVRSVGTEVLPLQPARNRADKAVNRIVVLFIGVIFFQLSERNGFKYRVFKV